MFCSKCGKTLKQDETNCPSCGLPVGDSRFEGNGYTATQVRFVSGEPDGDTAKVVPYTRTTYATPVEDGGSDEAGDVYSRTTYRPILTEDKADEANAESAPEVSAAPEDEAAAVISDMDASAPDESKPSITEALADEELIDAPSRAARAGRTKSEPIQPHRRATLPEKQVDPDEDPDDDIKIAPLRPIKKAGISPEVQQYMERANQVAQKPKKSIKDILGGSAAPVMDAAAAVTEGVPEDIVLSAAAQPDTQPVDDTEAAAPQVAVNSDGTMAVTAPQPNSWLKPLAIILCIAIILGVALWTLIKFAAGGSQLDGVGYDVHKSGIELIKSETTPEFINSMALSMQSDPTGAEMYGKLSEARAKIDALLPEKPLKNDEEFLSTLNHIQDLIDNAVATQSLAVLNKTDEQLYARYNGEAKDLWDEVNNAITRLEAAKDPNQLAAITQTVVDANATPAPPVETTPAPTFKVLKRGINNNARVKQLQQRLKKLGWFKSTVDSDYGAVTALNVREFQAAVGLEPADGITDAKTWDAIMADDAPTMEEARARAEAQSGPTLAPGEGDQQVTIPEGEPNVADVLDETITN